MLGNGPRAVWLQPEHVSRGASPRALSNNASSAPFMSDSFRDGDAGVWLFLLRASCRAGLIWDAFHRAIPACTTARVSSSVFQPSVCDCARLGGPARWSCKTTPGGWMSSKSPCHSTLHRRRPLHRRHLQYDGDAVAFFLPVPSGPTSSGTPPVEQTSSSLGSRAACSSRLDPAELLDNPARCGQKAISRRVQKMKIRRQSFEIEVETEVARSRR